MSAKEIKALIEVGTSLGYSGEELKQFLTEERMRFRLDKEREKQDKEKQQLQERQEKEKQMEQERIRAFELEKNSTREWNKSKSWDRKG